MTVLEFEAWVSDHYEELVALSRQQCQTEKFPRNEDFATEILHAKIEHLLEAPEKIDTLDPKRLMGWFNRALRGSAIDVLQSLDSRAKRLESFANQAVVLEQDVLSDARAISSRRAQFNRDTREIIERSRANNRAGIRSKNGNAAIQPGGSPLAGIQFVGPSSGTTRWRYQQLRDNRLFDERAIRSLADSMHRASARYRHDGEHGLSYTEFGAECGHRSTQEVAR